MSLRKWYFCMNQAGFDRRLPLIRAAVTSARQNTSLQPYCVYNGEDDAPVAALGRLGVGVVRHRSTFEADLRAGYGDKFDQFSGHWLRVDLPLIEREDDLILYTDIDVIFEKPPIVEKVPPFLAAAPEFDKDKTSYFSSGVMVMNLAGIRPLHGSFVQAIKERLHGDFRYPAHDQESFNRFFKHSYTPMTPAMNWKPFWGFNDDARIVHFHGPKPKDSQTFAAGKGERMPEIFKSLWSRSPEAYAFYAGKYDAYVKAATA